MATQTATCSDTVELTNLTANKSTHPSTPEAGPNPEPEPATAPGTLSRATCLKLISAGFSFFVAGVNDGSIGALLPYVIREYHVSKAIVSSVYGANFFGWLAAAIFNTHLCQYLDLGAMLFLGALCQVIAHALRSWDPPFGLFVATFWIVSIGQAFQDTHANTYVAGVGPNSHRWLAFIHAMYMAGCLVGPFVSTGVASVGASSGHSRWYLFYTFPLGIGVANLAFVAVSFRDTLRLTRSKPAAPSEPEQTLGNASVNEVGSSEESESKSKGAMDLIKATITTPSVWLLCMFFFFYIGSVLTASGWVVEYLVDVRHGDLTSMGYVPAGFNGGCLLGRLLLAEPTHRFGPRRMVLLYCVLALALQLVFWLVPNIIAASIAISFVGFFTGPLFATGIELGSKLFPRRIQSTALALVFVFAQMGGSVFPIITGIISSGAGVKVLQPILVTLLAATAISWLLVPRPKAANQEELHQE